MSDKEEQDQKDIEELETEELEGAAEDQDDEVEDDLEPGEMVYKEWCSYHAVKQTDWLDLSSADQKAWKALEADM